MNDQIKPQKYEFTKQELEVIKTALDLYLKSINRAIKTSKHPEFLPVYELEIKTANVVLLKI